MEATAVKTKMTYAQAAGENWTRAHSSFFAGATAAEIQNVKATYISDAICSRTDEIKNDLERSLGCIITD